MDRGALLIAAVVLVQAGCRPPQANPVRKPAPVGSVVTLDSAAAVALARAAREEVTPALGEGFELSLWASDSLLIDPHALTVDDLGRVYVVGSTRSKVLRAVYHDFVKWRPRSLSFETIEDLRALVHEQLAPERSAQNEWLPDLNGDGSRDWRDLTVPKERLYRIEDTSGDGLADHSQIMLEDFHSEITDIVGGVAVRDSDVFVAVSPDLWRLRDTDGDGAIDAKESNSHGYGIRMGFFAHGMSGATVGPDGRIYWSIGDLGLNVKDRAGRTWTSKNQGAILRSNPDGSDFEIFAAGLRNPYEFAFDEHGNLISGDNDADQPGEHERLVYVVDGSDSGWRTNLQYGKYSDPLNNRYRVWMDEGLWKPRFPGQAAYIVPPIANYHTGPAGMTYEPGTALDARWRNHFFIASAGSPQNSKIYAFELEPRGAGFALKSDTAVLEGLLVTGIEFGPDGALYAADLMTKIKEQPKGRIWKLDTPVGASSAERKETRELLARSFDRLSSGTLASYLRKPDMRVRLKAQFELAKRSDVKTLLGAVRRRDDPLARLHGLWGIGQIARKDAEVAASLLEFLDDEDPEVRAQAAKMIGDAGYTPAADRLIPLLRDPAPRPRFFAAQALGRLGARQAVPAIIAMLRANDGVDAYLRHSGSLALARIGDVAPIMALAEDPSRAVRLAAVVALRRMRDPGVARFLDDADELVVTEAARAINDDGSIEAAIPDLARLLERGRFSGEALIRRAINANLRLGTPAAARRLAGYAARPDAAEEMRAEAIASLGVWPEPSLFDRVDGMYRGPVAPRDAAVARAVLEPLVPALLEGGAPAIQVALAEAIERLHIDSAAPALLARVREDPSAKVRTAALSALHALGARQMESAVRIALADRDANVRRTALGLVSDLGLPAATTTELLASVIARGSTDEQQSAIEAIGKIRDPAAERVLGSLVDRLVAGTLPDAIQLEVIEAAQSGPVAELRDRVASYQEPRAGDPLAAFHVALHGGDADKGRQVFRGTDAVQCTQCHSVGKGGSSSVGPNLGRIGATLSREQLLQALVDPSARIAPGFGTAGAPSPMPPMGSLLTRREIRDVVEYLSTLK